MYRTTQACLRRMPRMVYASGSVHQLQLGTTEEACKENTVRPSLQFVLTTLQFNSPCRAAAGPGGTAMSGVTPVHLPVRCTGSEAFVRRLSQIIRENDIVSVSGVLSSADHVHFIALPQNALRSTYCQLSLISSHLPVEVANGQLRDAVHGTSAVLNA